MKHGSLFSGIGGFDLAAEWMGWENVFHCEWEDFPRKILNHYWPNAQSYGDIKQTDFTIHRGQIDILTGGFPCQPYSQAGKRLGKEDDRHLWPEMLRAIREIAPTWVVGENVRGLINWSGGLVFDDVQTDLEAAGYEVQPFLLPACGVNAPHRRDRIWFVAHSKNLGLQETKGIERERRKPKPNNWVEIRSTFGANGTERYAANAHGAPSQCGNGQTTKEWENKGRRIESFSVNMEWEKFPTKPPICGGNDGLPRELDGITFSKWRKESIKAYGNAIVPQIALMIFKSISKYEELQGL